MFVRWNWSSDRKRTFTPGLQALNCILKLSFSLNLYQYNVFNYLMYIFTHLKNYVYIHSFFIHNSRIYLAIHLLSYLFADIIISIIIIIRVLLALGVRVGRLWSRK